MPNSAVYHKIFGQGEIIQLSGHTVRVRFASGEKSFLYPDAFAVHLRFADEASQREAECLIASAAAEKAEAAARRAAERAAAAEAAKGHQKKLSAARRKKAVGKKRELPERIV